jgi:hypothetical protein
MKHLLALFAALVVLALGAPLRATCPSGGLVPALLTPITAAMPRERGALVAGYRAEPSATTALSFEGVRMVRGRRISIAMQAVEIAPGLVRLVPSATVRPGTYGLEGLGPTTDLVVGRTPMPGAPVRPVLSAVRRVAVAGASGGVELRATLGFPVPTGIVAILSAWGEASTPSVWSRAVIGQSEVVLHTTAELCTPDGASPPPEEGSFSVRIAYVDQFGQLSPWSDPVSAE